MPDVAIKSDAGNRPPVLTSLDNHAEHESFVDYFRDYAQASHVAVAEAEQKRLSYYWEALDKRLTRAGPVEKGGTPKRPSLISYFIPGFLKDYKPKDVYQKGDLSNIFKPIASQTRSIVLAEVTICPHKTLDDKALKDIQPLTRGGMEATLVDSHPDDYRTYSFGFMEIRHTDKNATHKWDADKSSIALPVLSLDDDMMSKAAAYQSGALLQHLQTIITLCNHDMMHNMINTISKGDISNPLEAHFKSEMRHYMEHKTGMHGASDPLGFESALIIGHAHTWEDLRNTDTGQTMSTAIEGFYDELERISHEMSYDMNDDDRHQVIDYFGTAVPYALARMVSLHDPLMERALDRAQKIDPVPQAVLNQKTYLDYMRQNKVTGETLNNYKSAGAPLISDDEAAPSYAEIKKLQLVRILPDVVILLSPARKGSDEYKAHARMDEMDRDIVNIITRHTRNDPA